MTLSQMDGGTQVNEKVKDAVKKDPFLKYGAGIKNYFELQWNLILLFAVLSVLAVAQMFIFKKFGGLNFLEKESEGFDYENPDMSSYTKYSFGMMGFSKNICAKVPIQWSSSGNSDLFGFTQENTSLLLQCEGTTYISGVYDSGIMLDKEFGGADDVYYDCYDLDMTEDRPAYKQNFDKETMKDYIMGVCAGQQSCGVEIPNRLFYTMND